MQTATAGAIRDPAKAHGWEIEDKPGRFTFVPKAALKVDHTYQRDTTSNRITKEIVGGFRWIAFGVLVVVRRIDGSLFVIDGQHRLEAVLKLPAIKDVPCIIFNQVGVEKEADAFLAVNSLRKNVSAREKFKARLVQGDPLALKVNGLIESHGLRVGGANAAGTVTCVTLMMRLAEQSYDDLVAALSLTVKIANGEHITDRILHALFFLFVHDPDGMTKTAIIRRIVDIGYTRLLRATLDAMAYHGSSGPRVWSLGIIKEVNRGARTNFLRLVDAAADSSEGKTE